MPKAQRSRACQQCRERRVKCDETPIVCQQCRRLGLKCSGPIQGSVIIDMSDRVAKPRQKKKRDPKKQMVAKAAMTRKDGHISPKIDTQESASNATTTTPLQIFPRPQKPPETQSDEENVGGTMAITQYSPSPTSTYQPSKIVPEALDLAFISHFVQRLQGVRTYNPDIPWLTHLPDVQQNASKPALRFSIRAASMAFYATVHKDTAILVDSYRWYTLSLNSQRTSLARIGVQGIPTTEEILVPIILSLYEVFAGTTTSSVWTHLTAVRNIIAMRGPHKTTGKAYFLFKAMRVSDAHISMIFNTPSIFSRPDWMTIPFIGQTKNAHQLLNDILFEIPGCISLCGMESGSMRRFFDAPIQSNADLWAAERRTRELIQELENWGARFPNLTHTKNGHQIVAADKESRATNGVRPATPDGSYVIYPDSFVALNSATFNSMRVILCLLLDKISLSRTISPPTSAASDAFSSHSTFRSPIVENAIAASQAVLECSSHMESAHSFSFDFMRSGFPVVVVATLGPREEEMKKGEEMLKRWGELRGISGLCDAWLNV